MEATLESTAVQSEWQVNYKNGDGWHPIDEKTMRRRLSGAYFDVNSIVELMISDGDFFNADTGMSLYRRNPDYVEPAMDAVQGYEKVGVA